MAKKTEAFEALSYRFSGDVDEDSVERAVKKLHKWSAVNPEADLEFHIHTPGGEMLAGWRLFDTLRWLSAQGHDVTTVVRGSARSMGAVLLQAGDTRVMGAQSWLMVHENSGFIGGALSQVKDSTKTSEEWAEQMFRVLANRSNLSVKKIRENVKYKDWWLDSQAALAAGLVDIVEGAK